MKSYNDEYLHRFSKCNLLDLGAQEFEYKAALQTAKTMLLRSADNQPITKQLITNTFETNYKTLNPNPNKDDKYWKDIKLGRRFISKLYWLLAKYEVLQPIQTYNLLTPSGQSINGEYALIQKRTETEKPLVLNFLYNRPLVYNYPEISVCTKWLHSKTNYLDTGIYNFAMFRGDDWKIKELNEPLITNWLYAILSQISSGNFYTMPGSHCNNCITKKCLEAYNAR